MKRTILFALALAVAMVAMPIEANARKKKSTSEVRNVIMLIGDGMGSAHISALMLEERYQPINMDRAHAAAAQRHRRQGRRADAQGVRMGLRFGEEGFPRRRWEGGCRIGKAG